MPRLLTSSIIVLLAALLTPLLIQSIITNTNSSTHQPPPIRGQNARRLLFFTLAESGQINVQLATAQALLEKHPNLDIHFASFPMMKEKVARVESFANRRRQTATPPDQDNPGQPPLQIGFHPLPGPDRLTAMQRGMNCTNIVDCLSHPPGARGAAVLAQQIELALWPWSGEEHMAIYERCVELIEELDPALVVVDFAFRPAMDAVERLNRQFVIMSPLALADIFAAQQPWAGGLWRYPALGTGLPFPVPWRHIPENIYVGLRLVYNLFLNPHSKAAVRYLRERGLGSHPLQFRTDVPFITQTLPEASIPVGRAPGSVICAGAIVLDSAPAKEQDPELAAWVQRAPTVVVNLGSLFSYDEQKASIMARALREVLDNSTVQVLWKVAARNANVGEEYSEPLAEYLRQDRVRIMKWLSVDTLPLLQLDNVVASVHHGGSNSYNEALAAGVPQVVIPVWEDHYNFAQLTEDSGLGVYATRGTAPDWTVAGIAEPVLRVVQPGDASARLRAKAEDVGRIARETPGRYVAAAEIARLLGPGLPNHES